MIVNYEKKLPNGQVRVHWLMRDEAGPIASETGMVPEGTQLVTGPVSYKVACKPGVKQVSTMRGGQVYPLLFSDDPRAVTCPECQKVPEFTELMTRYKEEAT